jgi:diacylglycerol kinase
MESKHSLIKSFIFAGNGLKTALIKGRNFRIQVVLGFVAVILGIVFRLSVFEWLSLILIIASVLILELINTAIEEIVNMVSPEIQPRAKIAKDVSAGAVLIASIAAIFIGLLLFLPRILH